jgi:hypothetical protein
MAQIIISLKRTQKKDAYIQMWKQNNFGYTTEVSLAGRYNKLRAGYHNTSTNVTVEVEKIEQVTQDDLLPNTLEVWQALGIESLFFK